MTIDTFLDHWQLIEHPFAGEEARQDPVFWRMVDTSVRAAAQNPLRPNRMPRHPDYDKVAGQFDRPSTSIVFGEKGSGKTAIRLQMVASVAAYNAANPARRVLLVSHDDLTPALARLHDRLKSVRRGKSSSPLDSFKQIRLHDHIDAILCAVVPSLIDAALEQTPPADSTAPQIDLGSDPRKNLKRLDRTVKQDLLVLQTAYDRVDGGDRTRPLRKALAIRRSISNAIELYLAALGWLVPLAVFLAFSRSGAPYSDTIWLTVFLTAMGLWLLALLKLAATERFSIRGRGRRLFKQLRVSPRSDYSFIRSIRQLPNSWRPSTILPSTNSQDVRLALMGRLVRALRTFGYQSIVVVIDRVDEPPLIQGDPEAMRAVVWPMLSNRFLQLDGFAFKLLLPIELRHQLMRESAAFFQDARLDKQSLIEQLAWTGVSLYDLCNQRLRACTVPTDATSTEPPIELLDLFAPDVTREMLVEALESVRQPRDAFKMLYQCLSEHCIATLQAQSANAKLPDTLANAPSTPTHHNFQISKRTLEMVKKAHIERLRQLALGIRPA
jgi:hypothetical protein